MDDFDRLKQELKECGELLSEDMIEDMNPIRFEEAPKVLHENKYPNFNLGHVSRDLIGSLNESIYQLPTPEGAIGFNADLYITKLCISDILKGMTNRGFIDECSRINITTDESREYFHVVFMTYRGGFHEQTAKLVRVNIRKHCGRNAIFNIISSAIGEAFND